MRWILDSHWTKRSFSRACWATESAKAASSSRSLANGAEQVRIIQRRAKIDVLDHGAIAFIDALEAR